MACSFGVGLIGLVMVLIFDSALGMLLVLGIPLAFVLFVLKGIKKGFDFAGEVFAKVGRFFSKIYQGILCVGKFIWGLIDYVLYLIGR